MSSNKFAIQVLVMAHVYGHVAFFAMNKFFRQSRQDIIGLMFEASKRFLKYEKKYGIDEVEKTIDAGHALQFHSSPFTSRETEQEKRKRIFEQKKKQLYSRGGSFGDLTGETKSINENIELHNQKLWREIKSKTPVEPTEDLLRYIIDNSTVLEDWQKDILEVLRIEGQYFWPAMKTKHMNEGFATYIHETVCQKLFSEKLLTTEEHADFNFTNSLIKHNKPGGLNPYYIGSGVWKSIKERWDKGQHGEEWENCENSEVKEKWDTKEMKGWEKCKQVLQTYTDWFFMQDFLTPKLVKDLKIYIYEEVDAGDFVEYVITKDKAKEIRDKIVFAFAQNPVPKVEIFNGNYEEKGYLSLRYNYSGLPLDENYAKRTMKHIAYLWGRPVVLFTKVDEKTDVVWRVVPEIWEAGDDAEEQKVKEKEDGD
jgi:stage V sporulation protein R